MTAAVTTAPAIGNDGAAARASRWTAYLIVAVGALFMLAPFWFMFVFATHSRSEIFNLPPPLWFGDDLLTNFRLLTERLPFWRNLGWSVYVALMATVLTLLFCSMAGYAFALMEFRFKKPLFGLVMATMLLPQFMNMIPMFMIMDALGWIDQQRALYVPGAASAFGIFLMRQFAAGIPRDLIEAARLDGASEWSIFARIVAPLMRPALAALGVFTFLASWNDYLWPLVAINDLDKSTIPLALTFFNSAHAQRFDLVMAAATMAIVPVLVVFLIFQRHIVKALVLAGMR
jgi:multiple sugar transport system permease protein